MMDLDQRLAWLVVGCALGYIIRVLQEIRREVHEVDEIVKKREKDEAGMARFPLLLDIALIILFCLTVWSAVRVEQSVDSAAAADNANAAQNDRIEKIAKCNLTYTAKLIRAVNERTTYTTAQVQANVDVLESQLEFLEVVLFIPPVDDTTRREALEDYVANVDQYIVLADRSQRKTNRFAYPTNIELSRCLGTVATVKQGEPNE